MLSVRGLCTPDVGGCQKISHIQQIKMSQSHSREKKKSDKVIISENYLHQVICMLKGKGSMFKAIVLSLFTHPHDISNV